jgi:hypothetical protein
MVMESIREFNRAVPFKPYEIRMVSGERFVVQHPDFISVAPKGALVVFVDMQGRPHHLNALLIEKATIPNGRSVRKRPARKRRSG